MTRRQWTLLFVSDSDTQIRQFQLPRGLVQLAIAMVLIIVSVLSSLGTTVVMKARAPLATKALEQKNELMKAELTEIQGQIGTLQTELQTLAQQDEKFRLVAGLDVISEDVQRVGIGGPIEPAVSEDLLKLDRTTGEIVTAASNDVGEMLRRAKLLNFSWREASTTLSDKHERLEATPSIVPTNGYLTSVFSRSRKHPIFNRYRPHQGVDITASTGTPIVAAAKGVVRFAGANGDFGLSVEIDHGHGVVTRYAHASKILAKRGQQVQRGDKVALVGATGLAVGPHLHYEVLVNGKPTDPRKWFFNSDAIAD